MGPPERVNGPNEYAGNRTCYSVSGFGAKIPPNGTGSNLQGAPASIRTVLATRSHCVLATSVIISLPISSRT